MRLSPNVKQAMRPQRRSRLVPASFALALALAGSLMVFGGEGRVGWTWDDVFAVGGGRVTGGAHEHRDRGHCLIHVHGFPHSGTGVARRFLNESLGPDLQSTMDFHHHENEGQHKSGGVMKRGRERGAQMSLCLADPGETEMPKTWGRLWYCPKQAQGVQDEVERVRKGTRLWNAWRSTWDLTKPYLIQKTPTFDVKYLDRLNVQEFASVRNRTTSSNDDGTMGGSTFHVVVMRHPFMAWPYSPLWYDRKSLLMNWLDVWEHVLNLFATPGSVRGKFAVVQYEVMADASRGEASVKVGLAALVREDCGVEELPLEERAAHDGGELSKDSVSVREDRRGRRRLEYHADGSAPDLSEHLKLGSKMLAACRKDDACRALMEELRPIADSFGYNLDDLESFHGTSGPILFSHRNPPGADLVRRLRELVEKYVGIGHTDFDPRHPSFCYENCR